MGLTISEAAAQHVGAQLSGRGKGLGIRVGVKTSGCSGMAYVLEFVDDAAGEDEVFEDHGVKVFIDPKSMVYLDGTELDFVREGLSYNFNIVVVGWVIPFNFQCIKYIALQTRIIESLQN